MRSRLFLLALVLGGCHLRTLAPPPPLPADKIPVGGVRFRETIAILPFEDGRAADDRQDGPSIFVYGGVDFIHTDLDELRGGPRYAFAEAMARALVAAHSFARVVLVERAEDAPEADFILSATLRRARGYVEANERPDPEEAEKSGNPKVLRAPAAKKSKDERSVLAEVWLEDVTIRSAKDPAKKLLRADLGWSIWAEKKAVPEPPDPWAILSEAMAVAHGQLTSLLDEADLSGAVIAEDAVEIGRTKTASVATHTSSVALFAAVRGNIPPGWRERGGPKEPWPLGWKGDRGRCTSLALEERQSQRFHRALGPYRPTVTLSLCSAASHLRFDPLVEFPAEYVGTVAGGAHLFLHAVGKSSWRGAVRDLSRFLGPTPPPLRHVFEVGEKPRGSASGPL
ncbi:MAG: hypothetical protein U1E65_32965 [Myxococcota bacterium]